MFKNSNNFFNFKKFKKIKKINIYLISIGFISLSLYPLIPKFYDYNEKVNKIKEVLISNNNLNLKTFSNINYSIFPSPRLTVNGINIESKDGKFQINNGQLIIVMNILNILNYQKFDYKKIVLSKSFFKIDIANITNLTEFIKKNKKKIILQNNNFAIFKKEKMLLEFKNVNTKLLSEENKKKVNFLGLVSGQKILIKYFINVMKQDKFILAIPEVDTIAKFFFKKNNKNSHNGFANIEVMNNYLQFDFEFTDDLKLYNSFLRNKKISTKIEGNIKRNPNLYLNLNFDITRLNLNDIRKKLLNQKQFLKTNSKFIKKINGKFNISFKDQFSGSLSLENGEIYFNEFILKYGKYNLKFDGFLSNIDKQKKINFTLVNSFENKKKPINIFLEGDLNTSIKTITFKKIIINNNIVSKKNLRNHELKFININRDGNVLKMLNYKVAEEYFDSFVD